MTLFPLVALEGQEEPPARVPEVSLAVLDRTATEQSPLIDSLPDTAKVAVRRTGDPKDPLTVYYQTGGSAKPGADYEELPGSVTFEVGAAEVAIEIVAVDDDLVEPEETVVLSLIVPPGLPGEPPIYWPVRPSEALVLILDDEPRVNEPPRVEIVTPPDGAVLVAPREVLIVAGAKDVDGRVVRVEFFADGESLGVVEPGVDPVPLNAETHPEWGAIHPFRVVWKEPAPGKHSLTAVATDDDGAETTSAAVEIAVLEGSPVPVVTVVASDAEGAEVAGSADGTVESDPAVFTIRRTGPKDQPLDVRVRLGGSAQNGVDYAEVSSVVTFAEGEGEVEVVIAPVDDAEVEGTEKVVLALVAPPAIEIFPPPAGFYWVGRPGEAGAVILDNDRPDNLPPRVEMVHPHDGELFRAPAEIHLIAAAADRDGTIASVEFFAGDRSLGLGVTDSTFAHRYHLVWGSVPAGDYALTAVATDDQGATQTSRAVEIKVVDVQMPPVVTVTTTDGEAMEPRANSEAPSNPAIFRVHRTGPTEGELTVYYQMRGSAENGVDYTKLPLSLTFGVGAEAVEIAVDPLPDDLVEGPETVVLVLAPVRCVDDSLDPALAPRCLAYVVGAPGMARAVILDDDAPANLPPRIAITDPVAGQVFEGPQDIPITAAVRDADGWVHLVEFYANDEKIGEQAVYFLVEPEPGQDQTFDMVWEDVRCGAYVLRAKATDDQGATSWSGPVGMVVRPLEGPTVVTVVAADPLAIEPGPGGEGDPGAFAVYRRGDLSVPLTVSYAVGGTATGGADYELLKGEVTIPEGRKAVRIPVIPLADEEVEPVETVVVELTEIPCITIYPPPPECYVVGEMRRAVVKILDRSEVPNRPPRVELVRPHEGEIFQVPAEIRMVAMAGDADGRVVKVDFYADGEKVGQSLADSTVLRAADVESCGFTFTWSGAGVGRHELVAVATDDDGAQTKSRPVSIGVIDAIQPPVVRIFATDPHAAERPEGVPPNPARFMVQRTGSLERDVLVFYSLHGTATPGEDYAELSGNVLIPAGKRSARIVIEPVNDDLPERVETVVVRLEASPMMGPIEPYRIGWPARACAVIVDNDHRMPVAQELPDGGFHLCLPAERGMPYRVEASEDLVTWIPVLDGLAEDGQVGFAEPAGDRAGHRFYRVRSMVMEAMPMDE